MTNPFKNTDSAFEAFYDEPVVVRLSSGKSQTVYVSVFQDSSIDPLMDQQVDTDIEEITVNFRTVDYYFTKDIQIGDTVERPDNLKTYKVSRVMFDNIHNIYIVEARSI